MWAISAYPDIEDYFDVPPGKARDPEYWLSLTRFLVLVFEPIIAVLWGIFFAVTALAFPPPTEKNIEE